MWDEINDLETAKRLIVNPYYEQTGEFYSNIPTSFFEEVLSKQYKTILDFGCGVGRNIPFFLRKFSVHGYDYDNMITLAFQHLGAELWRQVDWIAAPIRNLEGKKFDVIYASLCFQHIPAHELTQIIDTLHDCCKHKLVVISRGYLDSGGRVWDFITERFVPLTEANLEDGTENHQTVYFAPK